MIDLVMIPALMCDARFYAAQQRDLADIARMKIIDHTACDDIEEFAQQLLTELPRQFALAGTSMGGYIALEILRQLIEAGDQERLQKLCLIGTRASADHPDIMAKRQEQIEAVRVGGLEGTYGTILRQLVHEAKFVQAPFMRALHAMANELGKNVFESQQKLIMSRHDCSSILSKITCPTLLICGRQDKVTPLDIHQQMADDIASSSLIIVEQCGHLVPIEQPEAVTDAMRYWLVGNEPYRRARKRT